MVLPVKVSIDRTTHLAHTIDITGSGAKLGGLRTQLQVGAVVELQRGPRRAKFLIKWIREIGPNELHAGIECPDPQEKFWGVDLASNERETKKEMEALMSLLSPTSKA